MRCRRGAVPACLDEVTRRDPGGRSQDDRDGRRFTDSRAYCVRTDIQWVSVILEVTRCAVISSVNREPLCDQAPCVVDMSSRRAQPSGERERAARNKGIGCVCVGDTA
jgi:hypothetical protein